MADDPIIVDWRGSGRTPDWSDVDRPEPAPGARPHLTVVRQEPPSPSQTAQDATEAPIGVSEAATPESVDAEPPLDDVSMIRTWARVLRSMLGGPEDG